MIAKTETEAPKIYAAMIAIMRDVEAVTKKQRNKNQNYNFRGIDACYNELHDILAKHGVITLPKCGAPVSTERTSKDGGALRFVSLPVTYEFMAEDGSTVECNVVGESMDSGDKATNKAMSVAHKYALLQVFLIPTEEPKDPENDSPEPTQQDRYSDETITNLEKARLRKQGIPEEMAEEAFPVKKAEKPIARRTDGNPPDWMKHNTIKFIKNPKYNGISLDQFAIPQLQAMVAHFDKPERKAQFGTNPEMKLEAQLVSRALQFRLEDDDQIPGLERPQQD